MKASFDCLHYNTVPSAVMFFKCIPDCPGGGNPDGPLGRHMSTVRTAALPPEHGSKAIGLGGAFKDREWEEMH